MPTLGDHFSEEQKREHIKNNFIPGNVYYLYCTFTTPNKNKYLLLVCINPHPIFFTINSEINEFKLKSPDLKQCQVGIDAGQHNFLDYDSFIDCTRSIQIDFSEVENQLLPDMTRFKGKIVLEIHKQVIAAVKKSKTISRQDKELIIISLTNSLS